MKTVDKITTQKCDEKEKELKPLVTEGVWCDPDCPFLDPGIEFDAAHPAKCGRDGKLIDWYDYHLAHCQGESSANLGEDGLSHL